MPVSSLPVSRALNLLVISAVLIACVVRAGNAEARRRLDTDADRQYIVHDGIKRSYVVRLPAAASDRTHRLPLVLVLHGGGGNATFAESMTGFTRVAQAEGFIVVYPEGTGRRPGMLLTWNAGHCCGHAMRGNIDDVGFIRELLDSLAARYPVDPRRIYATGMSNGGMMVHRLGIELSDRIAAIAPVVATVFGDEARPAQAVSALIINGQLDRNVPPGGGPPRDRFNAWDGTPALPAGRQAAFWAGADQCGSAHESRDASGSLHLTYACANGKAVESYLLADSGHAWPGGEGGRRRGDQPDPSFDATAVIWNFFQSQFK